MNPENIKPNPITSQPVQPPPPEPVPETLPTGINTEQNSTPPTPENTSPSMHEIPKPKGKFTIFVIILLILTSLASLGYWAYQNYFAPSSSLEPTVTGSPTPTLDPTTNWKTYTSSNNYQVKYPIDWNVATESSGFTVFKGDYKIIFTFPSAYGPGICIFSDSPDFNNPYTDNPILAASKCPGEYVEFKGISGTFRRRSTPNTDSLLSGYWSIYTRDQEGNFVTVPPTSYMVPTPEYDKSTILLMDQILSTFKFLQETDVTSGWKQYTNPSVFYQVRYPNSWRIAESNQFVGFGPQEVQEDVLWTINIYGKADNSKASILANIGNQFSDKKQTTKNLEINGISALEIITTTPSIPTWYSDTILIEYGTSYITISNGAITDSELQKIKSVPPGITFSDFYNTFRFMN
jgi:hypothetical protein